MKYSLVLQSFGREYEYKRALFNLFSYRCHASLQNLESIILFTDNPQYFQQHLSDLPIQYILLTSDKIKVMRGSIDFLHRMKIAMIEEAFQLASGNLLYVDSDTFFIEDPAHIVNQLSPDHAFMHVQEYKFATLKDRPLPAGLPFRAFYDLITSQKFELSTSSSFSVNSEMSSWNAGVMAFHQSHKKLLRDVYSLTHQFYPYTQNHASEQYAFSVILQTHVQLQRCDGVVYHYWYRVKKEIMDGLISELLKGHPSNDRVKKLSRRLPELLENHILTLRDTAIQSFHENNFVNGYKFAIRALIKSPFNKKFLFDLGYHTRRRLQLLFK